MRDRLIELLKSPHKAEQLRKMGVAIGKYEDDCVETMIADFLLANGVILPPCKVGDIVYLTDGIRVYEDNVWEIKQCKHKTIYVCWSIDFDETAIGTSVFLTREEAERALAEREK